MRTWLLLGASGAPAQSASAALSGLVTSQEGGNMKGVVISAKRVGSTIAVSVVRDAQGQRV